MRDDLKYTFDGYFFLECIKQGYSFIHMPNIFLSGYRIHGNNLSLNVPARRVRELRSKLSVHDIVMKQHDICVAKIEEQVGNWNSEDVLYLAYEDLTMSPLLVIERLFVFCDLEVGESVVSAMAKEIVSPERA